MIYNYLFRLVFNFIGFNLSLADLFSGFYWNSLGPTGHLAGRCLVNLNEGSTVIIGTVDTTFTLCSVVTCNTFKFKCTAWLLRSSQYVLCTPPQLPCQPNPLVTCVALFRPQGVADAVSGQIVLLFEVILEWIARASSLHYCDSQGCLFGCEMSVRKMVHLPVEQRTLSLASLWGKKWIWCRFSFAFRGLLACEPPQISYIPDSTVVQSRYICDFWCFR
jgi:hypothetical protein